MPTEATTTAVEYEISDPFGVVVRNVGRGSSVDPWPGLDLDGPPEYVVIHGLVGKCKPWRTSDILLAERVAGVCRQRGFPFMAVEGAA